MPLLLVLLPLGHAWPGPLSSAALADIPGARTEALYSTQIRFDAKNVPVVTIGLMDGQRVARLSSAAPLVVMPEGPGGSEVITKAGRRWTATVEGGSPARMAWRLQVGSFAPDDLQAIGAARKSWKEKGIAVRPLELGSVFGFFGKVMDTRRLYLVTEEKYADRTKAEEAASALAKEHGAEMGVVPHLEQRPAGTVILTDGEITIRGKDVLWLASSQPDESVMVHDVEHGKGFAWHGREDRRYRGTLYLAVDQHGSLAVANMLPAEQLLQGLVPAEIYPSAPPEALKAQAVAARGELLAKIGHRHLADPYLVCADVHCQAYAGLRREDARTTRAVAETRGEMLFSEVGLVDAVYSSSCGGHGEHNENVWGNEPNPVLRGVPDGTAGPSSETDEAVRAFLAGSPGAFCGGTRFGAESYRWKKTATIDAVRKGLGEQGLDPGVVRGIRVVRRGVSGRALAVEVSGSSGKVMLEGELRIRKAFGGLRSSLFVHDATPGPSGHPVNFRFTGGGFGHGAGMCQNGAIGRAEKGQTYREILRHYYKGADAQRIY